MFSVGPIKVDPPLLLAPMEDVTNLAFRLIAKRIARPGLMFTEFVSAMAVHYGAKKTIKKMRIEDEERPLGIQIFGGEPDTMAETARLAEEMGADLVAFSGGKALGGPQASGILAGRRHLIASALLQQLDMDVAPDTWTPPKLIDRTNLRGVPHHGIGRGFKAGKEEIVGLLTALDRFVKADDAAANAKLEARLKAIAASLDGRAVTLVPAEKTGRVPVLEIAVPDALALSARLQAGDPPGILDITGSYHQGVGGTLEALIASAKRTDAPGRVAQPGTTETSGRMRAAA